MKKSSRLSGFFLIPMSWSCCTINKGGDFNRRNLLNNLSAQVSSGFITQLDDPICILIIQSGAGVRAREHSDEIVKRLWSHMALSTLSGKEKP